MKTIISEPKTLIPFALAENSPALPPHTRTVRYVGNVLRTTNERVLANIAKLLERDSEADIGLFVTSPGGATGTGMNFYDSIRHVLKPNLVSIASGEIDSSGLIIFLAGTRRFTTARTTALLHPAGRVFDNQRYTTHEMAAMLAEDRLKDEQYADVVAENSYGELTRSEVLRMMQEQTVLSPSDLLRYKLVEAILP